MSKIQPSHTAFAFVVLLTCCLVWGCADGGKKEPSPFPGKAANPQPAQNAFDVPVTANLTWGAAALAESYDIYFGIGSVAVESADNSSTEFKGNQTDVTYDPPGDLIYSTTYYWRIDPVNAFGTTKGDLWFFTTELSGNVICVDDTGGDDSNDGLSWATAVKTIQKGLDLAGASGWSVLVAAGIYRGSGNKSLDFNGKAVALKSVGGPPNCIIDCQNDGRAFYFHTGETSSAILDGFCIQYGKVVDANGGGICCDNFSSPTIRNCVIQFCRADLEAASARGGAIYCLNSAPTVTFTNIANNSGSFGGAIYCDNSTLEVRNCSIENNKTTRCDGGGIYSIRSNLTVTDCIITGNSTTMGFEARSGGAFYLKENPSSLISRCTIRDNSAGRGGAIRYIGDSNPIIANCTITQNRAEEQRGGGIYCESSDVLIVNSLIAGNSTRYLSSTGGGFYCTFSDPIFINCTIAYNSSNSGGGIYSDTGSPSFTNCILWGNKADSSGNQIYIGGDTLSLDYSCFADGAGDLSGGGTISRSNSICMDPQFVNGAVGDYHLQESSPCINVGLNTAISGYPTDLDGNPRVVNGTVDIGAYEKQ